jgi:hypothetical protein
MYMYNYTVCLHGIRAVCEQLIYTRLSAQLATDVEQYACKNGKMEHKRKLSDHDDTRATGADRPSVRKGASRHCGLFLQ